MSDSCPALWILRGTVYQTTPSGRLKPRDPEHRLDASGRCGHCHTTFTTKKERRNG
ncbi:hypothetical protein [Collinsella sp. Sow4_E3]|uniref:hypothetical protein n=1 Tax=Collinsella sp. Sow4_E3 TaxID=3438776 RepID=UPI003F8F92AC